MPDSTDVPRADAASKAVADGDDHTNVIYRFATVEFNLAHGELRVSGKPVAVEPRPLRLLAVLLHHVNEVVTKEELFGAVWDGRPTVEHVLTNAVSKLRSALGEEAAQRLVTVPRTGYRLTGPLQRLVARAADFSASAGQPVPGAEGYVLERPLGAAQPPNVWLARHAKLWQLHVFKFASDGAQLAALKREYTLYRVLNQELGPREDFARVVGTNFVMAPFFLKCEFGGVSLLEWACGPALPLLSVPERVALFLQIARSVAAAHSVGVLHKDLKPANVLIDTLAREGEQPAWQVRLTDFGSGRLLDPTRLAALGVTTLGLTQAQDAGSDSRSGTLMYLAPELMAGQSPTVQSDVYALGIVLYQLLAGDLHRPLATGWQRAVADELLVDDITAATESELAKRLGSVSELVDRLHGLTVRHRERTEREQARQRSAAERAELLRRRARRPWVGAAFASLALGLGASLALYDRTSRALRQAQTESARAQAINAFLNKDVLATAEVSRSPSGEAQTMVDVLRRASAQATARFRDQPDTEASVRLQLAQSSLQLRNFFSARQEFERALALLAPRRQKDDAELLAAEFGLSRVLAIGEQVDDARRMLDGALKDAGPQRLAASPELASLAARAEYEWLFRAGKLKEALVPALRLRSLVDSGQPFELADRIDARLQLAELHHLLEQKAQAAQAVAELTGAPFFAADAGPVLAARTAVQQARIETNQGKLGAALQRLQGALAVLARTVGERDYQYGAVSSELAEAFEAQGEFAQSTAALRAALVAFKASLGDAHQHVHVTAVNLGVIELNLGHSAHALDLLDEQRAWYTARAGRAAAFTVTAIDFQRGRALTNLGRAGEALAVLNSIDAKDLALASWGDYWPWKLKAEIARAKLGAGQAAAGATALREALPILRSKGLPNWEVAFYEHTLARVRATP